LEFLNRQMTETGNNKLRRSEKIDLMVQDRARFTVDKLIYYWTAVSYC